MVDVGEKRRIFPKEVGENSSCNQKVVQRIFERICVMTKGWFLRSHRSIPKGTVLTSHISAGCVFSVRFRWRLWTIHTSSPVSLAGGFGLDFPLVSGDVGFFWRPKVEAAGNSSGLWRSETGPPVEARAKSKVRFPAVFFVAVFLG